MGTNCQDAAYDHSSASGSPDFSQDSPAASKLRCSDEQLAQTLPTLRLPLTKGPAGLVAGKGWERAADFPGGPRNSVPTAVFDGCWYTFGGMRWPNTSTTGLMGRFYAAYANGGSAGTPPPPNGFMPSGEQPLYSTPRDAFKYCPDADAWEKLPTKVPIGMTGHGDGVVINGRYIVLAGSQEHITYRAGRSDPPRFPGEGSQYHGWGDQVLCFDTLTGEYSRLGLLVYGVKSSAVAGNGTHLFVVGGEPMTGLHCNAENVVQIAHVTPTLVVKTDDADVPIRQPPAHDIVQFEPPVRVGVGANVENVYALSHTHLLTNAGNKIVARTQNSGRSWETASVGNFVPPEVRNYVGVLGHSKGIGPYWFRSVDGLHLRDFGSIVESMGSQDNFSAFNSSSVDEISVDPTSATGFMARKTLSNTIRPAVSIVGFPLPLRCGKNRKKSYRTSPGGCPMYLQDSGSAVLAGPPQMLVQLAEVSFANYDNPYNTNNTLVALTSTDGGSRWVFASVVANASWFPKAQEGPSENALAVLSDGKTLLVMMRMDGGDGCDVSPPGCVTEHKPYYKATSNDMGKSWSFPVAVPGTGAVRPRLVQLGDGTGPLVLTGGRALNLGTRDILMWISPDGMGEHWTPMVSLSYWHNRLAANHTDRFTKYVNCSSATPTYGPCSKLPGGGGSESSGYTTVLWLGGRSGIVTYDRELNETSPGIFEGHNSLTYSMRFHI
jgi:hypothetical protein